MGLLPLPITMLRLRLLIAGLYGPECLLGYDIDVGLSEYQQKELSVRVF